MSTLKAINKLVGMFFIAGFLMSCVTVQASGEDEGPVKVLVIGESPTRDYTPRDSPQFRRVVSELQENMFRKGFRVVDAEAIAADLDWWETRRLTKTEALQMAKMANESERARNRVWAVVIFRIGQHYRTLSFTRKVTIQLSGEIYDAVSNEFLGSFDLPSESVSGSVCDTGQYCAGTLVGERARDLASELGSVLARILARLAPPERSYSEKRELNSTYTVTMRHLSTDDAMSIMEVMAEEFPGYRSHQLIRRGASLRRYEYVTNASSSKVEKWLTLLLKDMGLTPDREIELRVRDGEISIEKIYLSTKTTLPRVKSVQSWSQRPSIER